jgi:hypothetical protein
MKIKLKVAIALLLCFLFGMVIGSFLAFQSDFQYQEASLSTCNYANNLTELINLQSDLLSQYTEEDFTVLDKIDCEKLK